MKEYVYYIKLADIYCKLIIQDIALLDYLKSEYLLLDGPFTSNHWVNAKLENKTYCFSSKSFTHTFAYAGEIDWKQVDFIIMALLACQVVQDNILLLHASSIKVQKYGYAFFGMPGAGKSTIIKNVPKHNLLSDDTAVIKKVKNSFYLYSTPFDKKHIINRSSPPILLKNIYILQKAAKNYYETISLPDKLIIYHDNDINVYINKFILYYKHPRVIKSARLMLMMIKRVGVDKLFFNKRFHF